MGWGRLWAARGCSETIFEKVQKITPELDQKSNYNYVVSCFLPAPRFLENLLG